MEHVLLPGSCVQVARPIGVQPVVGVLVQIPRLRSVPCGLIELPQPVEHQGGAQLAA